jgi:ABC-type lipoprotein release transport system permease subunit
MNPLSPFTYTLRHKRSALLLVALIALTTIGLYVMAAVLDTIPARGQYIYLTKVSRVYPATGDTLEPGVIAQIETHPDVARVIPDNGLSLAPPTLIGSDRFRLMGVSQEDAQYLIAHYGACLKEGRLFEPRTNEIVLAEETTRALGVKIGDQVSRSINDTYYASVPAPLVVVGILEADPSVRSGPSIRVGFASREYLDSHESFAPRMQGILVVAKEGREEAVEQFLDTTIASLRTETETYRQELRFIKMGQVMLYVLFGIVNCVVAVVVSLVVGVINRIAMMQRVEEMGLLHALGYHKQRLIHRLTSETAVVTALGWVAGIGLAFLALYGLKVSFYYARGMELELVNLTPLWLVLPTPLVVIAFASGSVRRILDRLDAVAIVERGKLGIEVGGSKKQKTKESSVKPLSSWTFYLRHRRRGIMLAASMALMISGIAFPVFILTALANAMEPDFTHLRYVSQVSAARGSALDPHAATQIRAHSAVARIIPAVLTQLRVIVPPGGEAEVDIYGVTEDDLPALMALFELDLVEGRLPQTRSNEVVIPQTAALNRGLRVGDKIGQPIQETQTNLMGEDDIPMELEIVGLLNRDDLWIGFASREYLESHELTAARPLRWLIVPADGRKAELDAWLEESIASSQVCVNTYDAIRNEFRQVIQGLSILFAAIEFLIAAVAAMALAALNTIFFAQRREEFGILHAVGRGRPWLVLRTVIETGSTAGIAWLTGAAVCLAGLGAMQALIYAPRGLSLRFFDITPWLFTLPIPLAVIVASAGTIAWMLSRLDPVAIIERR